MTKISPFDQVEPGMTPRVFRGAQARRRSQHALSASGDTLTTSPHVHLQPYGTETPHGANEGRGAESSTPRASLCVSSGNSKSSAQVSSMEIDTSAQDVGLNRTALRNALEQRRLRPWTPYIADAWEVALARFALTSRYPTVVEGLRHGFVVGIPRITETFTPPNGSTFVQHLPIFNDIIAHEFKTGRYLGPFSKSELEEIIGPFQSSPVSLVPKPHKPEVLHMVQNLSFPHISSIQHSIHRSINSYIDSDNFPCTWGTFTAFSLLCARLPPGSQSAVRDVAEAYRTVPLHPSQWPGTIIRDTGDEKFILDPNLCFGITSGAGSYGLIADAGTDIMRGHGIGPIVKWVDDHVFLRILREYLNDYNKERSELAYKIKKNGGRTVSGGRVWFNAGTLEDGRIDEHVEDLHFPLQDLLERRSCSSSDARYT